MSTVLYTCYVLQLLTHLFFSIDKLVSIIKSFVDTDIYDTVVVSVCCGRAETEANCDPRVLCVCLDNDGSSLYASKVAQYFLWKKMKNKGKTNLIYHHHDYKEGLYELLQDIRSRIKVPMHILFQHPAPSSDPTSQSGRQHLAKLAAASRDCINALQNQHADSIHFVYDEHSSPDKTTWKGDNLKSLSTSKCDESSLINISVSEVAEVSAVDEDTVNHPLFGKIDRCGWAKLKMKTGCCERAFSIKNNI